MFSILKKELVSFFASAMGYMVIALFLLANVLLLWVFNSDFIILNAGFADLNSFFYISPWLFFFLIPAICMRSFVDEKISGTFDFLKTKPISNWQLVLGKYFGALILIITAILPSLIYVYSIDALANPTGNIDLGPVLGAYLGLLFIAGSYTAIGLFASAISNSHIVAFLIAILTCFVMFYGFEAFADLQIFKNSGLEYFGMKFHYNSLAKGVIDTRDIVYFLSISFLFLVITHKIIAKQ